MSYYAYAYYAYTHWLHTMSTTINNIVWETGNYCGKPHVYVWWGVSGGRGGQRYVSLGFAFGLSTDRNIPWEILSYWVKKGQQ